MRNVETTYFDAIDVSTGNRVTLRRDHPVVDGVRMLAPHAITPDGVIATRYDDGVYRTEDGRQYRDLHDNEQ